MIRWLREAYSPTYLITAWLIAWGLGGLLFLSVMRITGTKPEAEVRTVIVVQSCLLFFFFGVYRALRPHPVLRPAYAYWLAAAPWKKTDPLPDGPVHPVAQDVFACILLATPALYFDPQRAWLPLFTLVCGYLVALSLVVCYTGPRGYTYAVWFLFGTMALVVGQPLLLFGIAALAGAVSLEGYRRSLTTFPWDRSGFDNLTRDAKAVGWPYRALNPVERKAEITRWEGVVLSLLAGWAVFLIGWHFDRATNARNEDVNLTVLLVACIAMGCALGRWITFQIGFQPPISTWGRLRTGRIIIPSHDVILVSPFFTTVTGCGLPITLNLIGVPSPLASAIGMSVAMTTCLLSGPPRWVWQLTSASRLTFLPTDLASKEPARTPTR